jgi:hypothetical protein
MAATFVENRAGIDAMRVAPWMVEEMRRRAEQGRIRAEEIAPVRTGAYAFGLPGEPGVTGGGFHVEAGIRDGTAYARLSNDVHRGDYCYAAAVEFGTKHMRKQRPLGRAIDLMAGRALNLS